MRKYTLEKIDAVQGKQRFDKLKINNKSPFDEFESEIKKQNDKEYNTDLAKIYSYMNDIANMKFLSKNHFRDVTPDKEKIKEYEFKSGKLRVYAIAQPGGKIIVIGGYKNQQAADFNRFRSIKKSYIESINNKNNEKIRTLKK